jgi:hypothetical protein
MPISGQIASLRGSLAALAERLGLPENELRNKEGADGLSAGTSLEPDRLALVSQADLDTWLTDFGEALAIHCELLGEPGGPDAEELWWRAASRSRSALEPLLAHARQYQSRIEVTVEIDKRKIADAVSRALKEDGAPRLDVTNVVLFFNAGSLQRVLSGDHLLFEDRFLAATKPQAADRLLLILLADAPGRLLGRFLAVFGKDHLDGARSFLAGAPPLDRLRQARETVESESIWDDRPRLLTPDFLEITAEDGLEPQREELARLQNALAVGYLANRTVRRNGRMVSFFEGSRTVEVAVGEERRSTALYDLYRWVGKDPGTARAQLEIVRLVIASRVLVGEKSFEVLVATAPGLRAECETQLRILVDKNLVDSFERRERIEKLVRDYADEVSQRTTSLAAEVVDNTYKTVGLLVGVVIAYLLQPDQGSAVSCRSSLCTSSTWRSSATFTWPRSSGTTSPKSTVSSRRSGSSGGWRSSRPKRRSASLRSPLRMPSSTIDSNSPPPSTMASL